MQSRAYYAHFIGIIFFVHLLRFNTTQCGSTRSKEEYTEWLAIFSQERCSAVESKAGVSTKLLASKNVKSFCDRLTSICWLIDVVNEPMASDISASKIQFLIRQSQNAASTTTDSRSENRDHHTKESAYGLALSCSRESLSLRRSQESAQ